MYSKFLTPLHRKDNTETALGIECFRVYRDPTKHPSSKTLSMKRRIDNHRYAHSQTHSYTCVFTHTKYQSFPAYMPMFGQDKINKIK